MALEIVPDIMNLCFEIFILKLDTSSFVRASTWANGWAMVRSMFVTQSEKWNA